MTFEIITAPKKTECGHRTKFKILEQFFSGIRSFIAEKRTRAMPQAQDYSL